MDSLNGIRPLVMDYIRDTTSLTSEPTWELRQSDKINQIEFLQTVHNSFFKVFADSSHSPRFLINLLESYTNGLEGFSKNPFLQAVIAYACIEAIATRISGCLKEPWETLIRILVKYSSFSFTGNGSGSTNFKKPNEATLKFIIQYGSKELCPNPCLRLEILRFMRSFNTYEWFSKGYDRCCNYRNMLKKSYDFESHCKNIINTLVELSNNNTHFTIEDLPNVSPGDLMNIVFDNFDNIEHIIREFETKTEKSKFYLAFLMLLQKFVFLEKEKHKMHSNIESIYPFRDDDLRTGLNYCLSLCIFCCSDYSHYDILAQLVENDSFLQNYLIDTIRIIGDVSETLPDDDRFVWTTTYFIENVLHLIFKGHNKQFSKFQYIHEINGGMTPAAEFRLRFFQDNTEENFSHCDSDYGSESGYINITIP